MNAASGPALGPEHRRRHRRHAPVTPDTADPATATATVTVTDTAGNPTTVSIAFPAVAKADQTLTGFELQLRAR